MESTWATPKREIRHIHRDWAGITRSQLRTILLDYIETFYNRTRHQARLEHQTPLSHRAGELHPAPPGIVREGSSRQLV